MTGWVLDTNVISQFAPGKDGVPKATTQLRDWIQRNNDSIFLSVVSVVEITAGIAKLRRGGSDRRAADLEIWFGQITEHHGERILAAGTAVGIIAGMLTDQARARGLHPGLADILIASTAKAHGHGLMTHNVRHFKPLDLGLPVVDPLAQQLPD